MTDQIVDVNTDNLDDFSNLFHGKAAPAAEVKEETPKVEENTPEDNDPRDDTPANVETPEGNEDDPADPDPDDKPLFVPKKKTVQERINELTAKAKEAERREADAQRRIAELEALAVPKEVKKEEAPAVTVLGEPSPDDLREDGEPRYPLGEYDPRFIKDLIKFENDQRDKARETQAEIDRQAQLREAQEAEFNAQRDALKQDWSNRVVETVKAVPDFVEKVQALESTFTDLDQGYGEYLATTIMEMDNGTDVLYYLSTNLDEAQRIAALGPVKATIALGRIDAKFEKPAESPQPKVSEAPEPAPVNKGHKVSKDVADDTDDLDAFAKKFFNKAGRK